MNDEACAARLAHCPCCLAVLSARAHVCVVITWRTVGDDGWRGGHRCRRPSTHATRSHSFSFVLARSRPFAHPACSIIATAISETSIAQSAPYTCAALRHWASLQVRDFPNDSPEYGLLDRFVMSHDAGCTTDDADEHLLDAVVQIFDRVVDAVVPAPGDPADPTNPTNPSFVLQTKEVVILSRVPMQAFVERLRPVHGSDLAAAKRELHGICQARETMWQFTCERTAGWVIEAFALSMMDALAMALTKGFERDDPPAQEILFLLSKERRRLEKDTGPVQALSLIHI